MEDVAKTQKPIIVSSVDAYRQAVDARNATQQADLQFQTPEAVKKLTMAVELLQKQLNGLRERIELLESEDHVGGTPYSDGPVK